MPEALTSSLLMTGRVELRTAPLSLCEDELPSESPDARSSMRGVSRSSIDWIPFMGLLDPLQINRIEPTGPRQGHHRDTRRIDDHDHDL